MGKCLFQLAMESFQARGYKTFFFMLNSIEKEILNAHKCKTYQESRLLLDSDKPRTIFFPLINFKIPTIVGILTFISRKKFHAQLS